mmetsp:Transcript_17447/g.27878  ORF Transcript_17447/g.27878 Transcript_17447/m.27878 type:complete len:223 (-) Transcript_17447:253-921(-)|eukprot:jgi/Bigna1/85785/estExt_fgenesh1_pg.C_60112
MELQMSTEHPIDKCPSCGMEAEECEEGFHIHLMLCARSSIDIKPHTQDLASKIQSMLRMITKLPLRRRISIMESFYRLSRTTSARTYLVSPKDGTSDRQVLNLLYAQPFLSRKKTQKRPRVRPRPTPINTELPPSMKRIRSLSSVTDSRSFYPFKSEANAEISDSTSYSTSSPIVSPNPSPIFLPFEKDEGTVPLHLARKNINEAMIRKIISQIEPSYDSKR